MSSLLVGMPQDPSGLWWLKVSCTHPFHSVPLSFTWACVKCDPETGVQEACVRQMLSDKQVIPELCHEWPKSTSLDDTGHPKPRLPPSAPAVCAVLPLKDVR